MQSNSRIPELDGLRGVAVIMVMLWHFTGSMVNEPVWLAQMVQSVTVFGRTGVDLFFVLSGYLIVGILIDYRSAPNLLKVFYWRRVLRIFPPYFLLVATYWICYAATGESAAFNTNAGAVLQLFAQITFTWNWLMVWVGGPLARGFAVTWSVAIEEWFYLIAPWVILLIPAKRLPALLGVVGGLSITARAAVFLFWGQEHPLAPYILTPLRLDGLCVGGLLAFATRSENWLTMFERNRRRIAYSAVALVIATPVIIGAIRPALDFHMFLWGHTYLSLGYGVLLLAVLQGLGSSQVSVLRLPLFRQAGRYSYSLYLFHPLILSLYFVLAGRPELIHGWSDAAIAAAALLTSVLTAAVIYVVVERPMQRLGHRKPYLMNAGGNATP